MASIDDYRAFYDQEPPAVWLGLTDDDAFGVVAWDDHGRAWAFVDARSGLRPVRATRSAWKMLAALRKAGERELWAFCDQIPKAERWLRHLGFRPAGVVYGREVWRCLV